MSINWIIEETKFGNEEAMAQRMSYAVQEAGGTVINFKYIPFGGETDYSFLPNSPAVFYGSANALLDIKNRVPGYPKPLAWYDEVSFACTTYYKKLAPYILQQNYQLMTLDELTSLEYNGKRFIRPNDNEKSFVGAVVDGHNLQSWLKYIGRYGDLAGKSIVITAPLRHVDREWRFTIVNGKVVAGSQYSTNMCLDIHEYFPAKASAFAEELANHWSPYPVYVIDVGLVDEQYKVVEIGPFNYAGLYKSNLGNIVEAIHYLLL